MTPAALPLLGALSGAVNLGAVAVEQTVFASADVAAGRAPRAPGGPQEAAVASELRPGVTTAIGTERSRWELTLAPRLYYRAPNIAGIDRPLVLGQGAVRHEHALSERTSWRSTFSAQYGEVEYSNTALVFDAPVSQPELDPVLTSLDLTADSSFAWTVTPRYELTIGAIGSHTEVTSQTDVPVPTTRMGGADLTQRWQLDPRSTLSFPMTARYYSVSDSPDWVALSPAVDFRHVPARRTTLDAIAGVSAVQRLGESVHAYPRLLAAVERVVYEAARARFTNRFSASLDARFDPLTGELYPIGGVEASLYSTIATNWWVAAIASTYTALTSEPVTFDGADAAFAGAASVGHRFSEAWSLEFGVRTRSRARRLLPPLGLVGGETWAFARLSVAHRIVGDATGPP